MVSLAKKERCLIKHILFVIHVLCTLNVRYNFTLRNMTKLEIDEKCFKWDGKKFDLLTIVWKS